MSFKPKQQNKGGGNYNSNRKFPTPKAGNRPGRVSLIVDMGEQEREPFEDENTGEVKELKPVQQVAVFADLTNDVVDYGDDIGEQPYRLMLNTAFKGDVKGITFAASPPKQSATADTWTFHSGSKLTKLANATGQTQILQDGKDNMDIAQLLGKAAMFEVEVKSNPSKTLKDDEGNPVIFTNVKCKGISSTPEMPDGSDYPVPEMAIEPMFISFENATVEMVRFIRKDLRETIKKALDYEGSNMQIAIDAFENNSSPSSPNSSSPTSEEADDSDYYDDFDDDIPF